MKSLFKPTLLALAVSLSWTAQASNTNGVNYLADYEATESLTAAATNLKDAVEKAINRNPEVAAAWHIFNAAGHEQDVAKGEFLPKIDLTAGIGNQQNEQRNGGRADYDRETLGISLTQNIFNGFATVSEVERLSYTRLARYYDFMNASSNIAVEAIQYYQEVLKYRELVELASENFVQHKKLYDSVMQKTQAGVARGVDLEQATGRLALAESNLLTEATNLHTVSAKYQNVVGEIPAEYLDIEAFSTEGLPADMQQALQLAYQGNPEFNSVMEQVLAATAELDGRNAPFLPKLDFRANHNTGTNVSGIQGRENDQVIELVASYNLFNGGSDMAAKEQFHQRLQFARSNRDKVCRNIRQELHVSYNDIVQLTEKLNYLNQHQLSTSKAREAYKSQFDIGQRSLLDLLDTENEYFQAKRAYVTAQHDLIVAQARSLHQTGGLLTALGVQRESLPTMEELGQNRDMTQNLEFACPTEVVRPLEIDKLALTGYTPTAPVAVSEGDIRAVCTDVEAQVNRWHQSWISQDVRGYLSHYSPDFTVPGMSRAQWLKLREARVGNPKGIRISISNLRSSQVGNRMEAVFQQSYHNDTYTDTVEKVLVFNNVGGQCRIVEENVNQGRLY